MADDKAKKKAPDAGGRRSSAAGETAANTSGGRAGTRKSTAKRTSAKSATGKKAPAKKAPAKKTASTPAAKTAPGTPARKAAAKTTAKTAAEKSAAKKTAGKKSAAKTASKAPSKATSKATGKTSDSAGTSQSAAARRASALVVGADEAPWSEAELAEVSHDLEGEASRLRAEIEAAEGDLADLLRDGGDGAGDDQADAGSAAFEREHELSLTRNARDVLGQVEHALHRIEDGSYGSCERCGKPIGKARLQAFPRATLCMSCKQLEERH